MNKNISNIKVLFIDDEENNLKSFIANYRPFFDVRIAQSIQRANEILANEEIHVLVVDQRMPEMTGIQFINSLKKESSKAICILVSGYTELETVIESMNKGIIYGYFFKPLPISELKECIEKAHISYLFRKIDENQQSNFRYVFENSNEAVFYNDKHGKIQEMNFFGLNLFKIKRQNLNKISIKDLIVSEAEYKKILRYLIKNKFSYDLPVVLKDSKQNILNALLSAIPIYEDNVIIGYQCLVRDVTQQQKIDDLLTRTLIETQENERYRFSTNLHDSIGQKLSGIRLLVQALRNKTLNDKNENDFELILKSLSQTIIELRQICFNIMPKTLEVMGLKDAIQEIINQSKLPDSIEIKLNVKDLLPRFNIDFELTIFRIVQEFLNNSIKHSGAKEIFINIDFNDQDMLIQLKDNGCGFDAENLSKRDGFGIQGIISRVQAYNGKIDLHSNSNSGTKFEIRIPISGKVYKYR